ncbi:glycosyltransferase [Staphylococcus sp. SQ8-PEA]|uniref:Glycosyltransferase n=1 Tax=Staphylococcus marylandisciuri TaxID=2981529 RepID=A0ABT2QQJ6_9STAP|nr:macrolide family glycosyltransferase [Staphylococcus marylandisciuri]MCU5746260.1 glycosyltransferase [Staphylococcus marylandisciuri]
MSKVLVINVGSEGHVNPTISLMNYLTQQGEDIVYYASEQFADKLENTGVEVRTISTESIMTEFRAYGNENLFQVINGLLRTADIIIPRLLSDIESEHYDYVIYDSMFSLGWCIAQHMDIPSISLYTSFAESKATFDKKFNNMAKSLSEEELNTVDEIFSELKHHVESTYDVTIPSRYEVMYNPADLNISFMLKGFQPDLDLIPEDQFIFAGPSLRLNEKNLDVLDSIDESKPLIYISLGTVFNSNHVFFKQCVEAFTDLDVNVIMSVGHNNSIDDLGSLPDHFIVKNYVPQLAVLKKADLFLTHGGMNSTNEALVYKVPMMAFPQGADQPFVSKQIEGLQLGARMNSAETNAAAIKQEATALLNNLDLYKKNIQSINEQHPYTQPGYQVAAKAILDYVNKN